MSDQTTTAEIQELLARDSLRLNLIDSEEYVKSNQLKLVTSVNIFEPNSTKFHPAGLFSEEIFGSITSTDRFITEAAIDLHTKIIHPVIFANLIERKALFTGILSGKKYAIFNEQTFMFELADRNDPKAETGYSFFIKYLPKMYLAEEPNSLRAKNLHKLLAKYKNNLFIRYLVCLPAGLRDLDINTSRLSKDDINKMYLNIINLTAGLSSHTLSEDQIFDGIRYQLQLKITEIYSYIGEVVSGKGGFFQKHYGARKVAFSTRNVISVPIIDANSADDPINIKADETMVPILNLVKVLQPFFVNYVKNKLYGELFIHGTTENIPVTNPETLGIEYINITSGEMAKYTTSDGINRLLNNFKHVGFRENPVSITSSNRKKHWLMLTYSEGDSVFIAKSADDLKNLVENNGLVYNKANIRPLRWVEALYIAGVEIAKNKHVIVTRYPVIGDGSIYPSKIHPVTTNPSKKVTIMFEGGGFITVPHYPGVGVTYYESAIVHQSRLSGLGADFDGDMVSLTAVWTDEGNNEISDKLRDISSVIGSDLKLKLHANNDIVKLTIHNLSKR